MLTLGAILATLVTVGILALGPWLSGEYFGGNWVMVLALIVAIVVYAPAHFSRGLCSGTGRFRAYAVVMGADGLTRIVLCLGLAAIGVKAVGMYGFAVAIAPLVGVVPRRVAPAAEDGAGPGGVVAGGHAEPRVAAARLGHGGRSRQRRPDRDEHPRQRRRARRSSPASATA